MHPDARLPAMAVRPSTKSSLEGGVMLSRYRALMKQRIPEAFREPRARSRLEKPNAAFLAVNIFFLQLLAGFAKPSPRRRHWGFAQASSPSPWWR